MKSTGRARWIGRRMPSRTIHGNYAAVVYLYRRRANLAVDLWNQLHRAAPNTAYCEDNSLIFSRPVLEDEIPEFSEHLSRNLDEFIAFMSGCGGLKKYLPRTP
jgi:hypothetical protein